MKYEIIEEKKRLFYGVTHPVDMEKITDTNFGDIWDETMKLPHQEKYNSSRSSIGLEVYGPEFMATKRFTYSALIPIDSTDGLKLSMLTELPEGKYIRFETTFEELPKGAIKKVYDFIEQNQIPVFKGFDYEEYPPLFNHTNPKSTVYIVFRYNELEE